MTYQDLFNKTIGLAEIHRGTQNINIYETIKKTIRTFEKNECVSISSDEYIAIIRKVTEILDI